MSLAIGKQAEVACVEFLEKQGYLIQHQNYKYGRFEIDIIAKYAQILVFFEVKFRKSSFFGDPEKFLSLEQEDRISQAAAHYIDVLGWDANIRFDVLAVTFKDNKLHIKHFKDAF